MATTPRTPKSSQHSTMPMATQKISTAIDRATTHRQFHPALLWASTCSPPVPGEPGQASVDAKGNERGAGSSAAEDVHDGPHALVGVGVLEAGAGAALGVSGHHDPEPGKAAPRRGR